MQTFTTSCEISKQEMDDYVWFFFVEDIKTIPRIIINFLPNKERTEKFVRKLALDHPLVYLFSKKIIDENGMPIVEIQRLEEDLELHIITQMTQDITIGEHFIWSVMDRLKLNKSIDLILSTLRLSPAFSKITDEALLRVLWHYYDWNYYEFSHITIPMIEWIFRNIIEIAWWTTIKSNKLWWYDKKSFWDIIFDPILTGLFWEDFILYNRVLFCERAWLNLRNRLAHWIDTDIFLSKNIADRIFHVMLYFSTLRKK